MTDKDIADHVYIEPMNLPSITQIIEKERPDALLPNMGGQTGLNLAMALYENGTDVYKRQPSMWWTCATPANTPRRRC